MPHTAITTYLTHHLQVQHAARSALIREVVPENAVYGGLSVEVAE